jgi:hypothetical protein
MKRDQIARWILEKLLGSFVISILLVYGPLLGFRMEKFGMGTTYTIITLISLTVSILVNILVPREFEFINRIKERLKKNSKFEAE